MPSGHNAFQRNAFQRSAFQIVYSFVPTVDGGLVLGGNVTARFHSRHRAIVDGGIVLGGSVTCSFHRNGHHRATVDGGIILGGAVRCRFIPGVVPVVRSGGGGRNFLNIFRRKHHYKPKVTGGLILGGGIRSEFFPGMAEEALTPITYLPRTSGGLVLGGGVIGSFYSSPPPVIAISEKGSTRNPVFPVKKSYKARVGPRTPILPSDGVKARFTSHPPPVRRIPYFSRSKALRQRILAEDEMLLMGILGD